MSDKKKSKAKTQLFLKMRDGRKLLVLGNTGRYWITQAAQFKKNNSDILEVIAEAPDAGPEMPPEAEEEPQA